jgi:hypothetical protein
MLKPTLLIIAPIGLLAGRHWRALIGATVTVTLVAMVSILLFGLAPWLAWFEALPRFREIFDTSPPLYRNGITPYAFALYWGLSAKWVTWAMLPLAILGTAVVFARSDDWRARMAAAVGGSLLVSPYAMNYELAALAPVVLTMRREKFYDLILPAVWGASLFFNASLLGLAGVYLWALASAFRRAESVGDNRRMHGVVDIAAREHDDSSLAAGLAA